MKIQIRLLFVLLACLCVGSALAERDSTAQYRDWVEQFKQAPRGPFKAVRWFCADGSILPPKKWACRAHGGGRQHGDWNAQVLSMRDNGFLIANVLAALEPGAFVGVDAQLDDFKQILLEQFLVRADDGWVFRSARFHRGALQVEDEQLAAKQILLALLEDQAWLSPERYLLLREAVQLLPLAIEPQLGARIRQTATDISEADEGFYDLRVKIHSLPDAGDAARVRAHAAASKLTDLHSIYASLASDLDALYASHTTLNQLKKLAGESRDRQFKQEMEDSVDRLRVESAKGLVQGMAVAASRAQALRYILLQENDYSVHNRLRLLRASLILEQEVYALGNQLLESSALASRANRLEWLRHLGSAVYATGLLSHRQWQEIRIELDRLGSNDAMSLAEYESGLRYLARVAQWAQRSLEFHFSTTVERWQQLTPLASSYVPDRLRGSPLLPFTRVLDSLIADANQLSGMQHRVFGHVVASGLRALNPGLRRGVLMLPPSASEDMRADGIYILQSTRQDLTPVAGIFTRGEGSSVSHVQLLARNLGIPNVVVDDALYAMLKEHVGERIVVAVSQRGVVAIEPDGPAWDTVFGQESLAQDGIIKADLKKLNLRDRELKPLSRIRASDSGRTVGPKAANLGELLYYYPKMVNPGLVIPFGVFRAHLEQPIEAGGPMVFEWMKYEYARREIMPTDAERKQHSRIFLARLRAWIENSDPGQQFRQQLRRAIEQAFGTEDDYGVFVRSDTNVEDLPGFTGAGLNLTVPNVVGFDAIMTAILRVWASPFSDRSFAWRQSFMGQPEHVYPAVLLLKSFASEKSGVLITSDIDSGDRDWLSIASNEGVGGAVDGQAAEELRVHRSNARVRFLAQASAPMRAALKEKGGMQKLPASGASIVLRSAEIEQLRSLAADVEQRFPLAHELNGSIDSKSKSAVVADIEFGFRQGQLALFQIRPFVESKRARQSRTLMRMDAQLPDMSRIRVALNQIPLMAQAKP